MNVQPKVSIIIPCYNQGEYLPEAINSILNQNWKNFEVIIVNDGSNDRDTLRVIRRYEGMDNKIKVIHTCNQGLPSARNNGIKKACGKYIFPLDADDKVHPLIFEKLIPKLENDNKIGIVYSDVMLFGALNHVWERPDFDIKKLLSRNLMTASSLFRRDLWEQVGGYDESMIEGFEDWNFWIAICKKGFKGIRVAEPLFYYRKYKNGSMLSRTNEQREKIYTKIIDNHQELFSKYFKEVILEKDNLWVQEIKSKAWYDDKYKAYFLLFRLVDKLKSIWN